MATLPDYVRVISEGYGESFDPAIRRTEMERGVPKQSLVNSNVLMKLQLTLLFMSADDIAEFDAWYFDTINRIGWFDMRHPRTRQIITARFENGSIGTLTTQGPAFSVATRALTVEYLRV